MAILSGEVSVGSYPSLPSWLYWVESQIFCQQIPDWVVLAAISNFGHVDSVYVVSVHLDL